MGVKLKDTTKPKTGRRKDLLFAASKENTTSQVALVVKKKMPAYAADVRDVGLIPGLGRSPAGGLGNPFQYSCLENPWT